MTPRHAPFVLIIRDGWGVAPAGLPIQGNAVALAATPKHDGYRARFPTTAINASEHWVGLPAGQMGNSEVGHLNMGAGRIVYQELTRITKSIEDGDLFENPALLGAMTRLDDDPARRLHLIGLVSDGGVHSHTDHLDALLALAAKRGVAPDRVLIHAVMDGRDTPPRSGAGHLETVLASCARHGVGRIATVTGRYFTMDRDQRWDRVGKSWDALVDGRAEHRGADPAALIRASYDRDVGDEFIEPAVVTKEDGATPVGPIASGDSIIFWNFRADRARQLCSALVRDDFEGFDRGDRPRDLHLVTLTRYADDLPVAAVAFEAQRVQRPIGVVFAEAGLPQARVAETEKYAHVTYFFSGGEEAPVEGERRCLVPSPRVATYDLAPAMSSAGVADEAVAIVEAGSAAFIVVNFANPDMVGHTGKIPAAIQAIEATDLGVGRIVDAALRAGGGALITADHGNVEQLIDPMTGAPHTAHTTNPVEALVIAKGLEGRALRKDGRLADLAPTILGVMGIGQPPEMTGTSLLRP